MTKVLVCGLCPLPFENTRQSFGPGIRTWQFAWSLANSGFDVHLVAMRIPGTYDAQRPEGDRHECRDGVTIERLPDHEFFQVAEIQARIDDFAPNVVVGATMYGSNMLSRCHLEVPFWADQFGHVMAEAQAKAHLDGTNAALSHFWNLLRPILLHADKISTVSEPQRYAAIGELGIIGRLTHETCGYEFAEVIPCALIPNQVAEPQPMLRGEAFPEDAFVVLWSGGYNVWSDVETMFLGLERAMDQRSDIHFVSTGGEIEGHDESTYQRFQELIEASEHRQRFHLQGWVKAHLVPSFQAEANLGVLSEIPIYEGQLGSKNRIVQWMGSDLPVLYNRVGELGDLLDQEKLGLTFAVGDAEAMGKAICWAAEQPAELQAMAEAARRYTEKHLTFEATTRSLVAWVTAPSLAPDSAFRHRLLAPGQLDESVAAKRSAKGKTTGSKKPMAADGSGNPNDGQGTPSGELSDQELDPTEAFLPAVRSGPSARRGNGRGSALRGASPVKLLARLRQRLVG